MKRKYSKRKTQPVDKLGCKKRPVGNLFRISSEGLRPGQWPSLEAVLHMSRIEFEFRPTEYRSLFQQTKFKGKKAHFGENLCIWFDSRETWGSKSSKARWIKAIRFSEYLNNSWNCRVKYIRRFTAAHSFCCTHMYERMWQFINIQSFCRKCRKVVLFT